jgi:hypothetical protein
MFPLMPLIDLTAGCAAGGVGLSGAGTGALNDGALTRGDGGLSPRMQSQKALRGWRRPWGDFTPKG